MATAEPVLDDRTELPALARAREETEALAKQWRSLGRAATFVALLTSPALYSYFHWQQRWGVGWSLVATLVSVAAFRGLIDLILRRLIPWPSLFGTDDRRLREEDVLNRRRAWTWRFVYKVALLIGLLLTIIWVVRLIRGESLTWLASASSVIDGTWQAKGTIGYFAMIGSVFLLINIVIIVVPLMAIGASQIKGFEPGDADWGVRLDDVRGQKEAKEEVTRIVNLWQSGEAFEKAGGKRERGIIFFGAPGTGKTMLAKAIATGFNCPIVTIPGSGFAQTFMGVDALIVRYLSRKAKKLAFKWGGQCIVFIDEIDAVGMRRNSLGGGMQPGYGARPTSVHDYCFFGPMGSLTPTGDLVLEDEIWRDRLFEQRSELPQSFGNRAGGIMRQMFPGMFGGGMGQLALNQLLVVMDGIDNPRFFSRLWRKLTVTTLDAMYFIPRRIGKVSLRPPKARPTGAQIYFIGATNVPLEALDPALRRPGRMGRHVWFRTPTRRDREDIFDLYLDKVGHDPDLDSQIAREELGRITNGYSPAMIEQICSMALTHAHHDGREVFSREDILEAMTTVESGTAVGVEYVPEETRAVAIHEAGHAVAAHLYMKGAESTRLSIRMRAGSLGHHQALEKEERFSSWRSEEMGRLVWTLGAMAAEHVFYGENATGVGGDLYSATMRAGHMVGDSGMTPERVDLNGGFKDDEERDEAREQIMKRFERIGSTIMNRSGSGSPLEGNPYGAVFSDRDKRALATQILGQAYVNAYHVMLLNRDAVEHLADVLIERKELYGNELVDLLNEADLKRPEVDLTQKETWPIL